MHAPRPQGFTLVELLIVLVIIGILASIALPRFADTKERAYLAAMKSDLRNIATMEEGYFADNQAYVAGTAANRGIAPAPLQGFVPSAGVQVTVAASAGVGWSAVATHVATSKSCAMFIGVAPVGPAVVDGEPRCQ